MELKSAVAIFDRFKKKPAESDMRPATSSPTPTAVDAQAAQPAQTTEAEQTAADVLEPPRAESEQAGLFARFRQGLDKTAQVFNTDIRDLFKQTGQLVDDAFLSRLFASLVRTDMGAGPANEIRQEMQQQFRGRVAEMADVLKCVKAKLLEFTEQEERTIELAADGPTVIMVVGVYGSGKTTSIAKLTHLFTLQGKKVVLGAGDTFRAAAVEQL